MPPFRLFPPCLETPAPVRSRSVQLRHGGALAPCLSSLPLGTSHSTLGTSPTPQATAMPVFRCFSQSVFQWGERTSRSAPPLSLINTDSPGCEATTEPQATAPPNRPAPRSSPSSSPPACSAAGREMLEPATTLSPHAIISRDYRFRPRRLSCRVLRLRRQHRT